MSLSNSCLTTANDDDMQNDLSIIENQVNDNDNDDDYMVEIDSDAYLNLEAMDKYEMYDIAFENLTSQDQLKKN